MEVIYIRHAVWIDASEQGRALSEVGHVFKGQRNARCFGNGHQVQHMVG